MAPKYDREDFEHQRAMEVFENEGGPTKHSELGTGRSTTVADLGSPGVIQKAVKDRSGHDDVSPSRLELRSTIVW